MDPSEREEISELRYVVFKLRDEIKNKDGQIQQLKNKIYDLRKLHKQNMTLERRIKLLNSQLQEKEACVVELHKLQIYSNEREKKIDTLQTRYKKVCEWLETQKGLYKQECKDKKQMKDTYKSDILALKQKLNSAELEIQDLHKENDKLQKNAIDIINLKQQLAERDKALKEERDRSTNFEDYLHDAMKIIQHYKQVPRSTTYFELMECYVKLQEKHKAMIKQHTESMRKMQKRLEEKKQESVPQRDKKEDGLMIAELQWVIREQNDKINSLQAESIMYYSRMNQLQCENERLEEKVRDVKKQFFKAKSDNLKIQELIQMEQKRTLLPQVSTATNRSIIPRPTPLPPISSRPNT